MKTSLIARFGIAATVAALTLVGVAVPAAQADPASIKITTLKLTSTTTTSSTVRLEGVVQIAADSKVHITGAKTDVTVNGRTVAYGVTLDPDGIDYQRAWGAGIVRLTNIKFSGTDDDAGAFTRAVPTPTNAAYVQHVINPASVIKIKRVNSRLKFKATFNYISATGANHSVGKVVLQYKKAGKWKKLKTLKLNRFGKATYKITLRKKRSYRVFVPTTLTFVGGTTTPSRKI